MIRIEISSNSKNEEDVFFLALRKFFATEFVPIHASSENSLRKEIWIDPDSWSMSKMSTYAADD